MATDNTCFYTLLGVDPGSDAETVRAAYLKIAWDSHPDRAAKLDPAAQREKHEHMRLVNRAYAVLKDPRSRKRYDDARSRGLGPRSFEREEGDRANDQAVEALEKVRKARYSEVALELAGSLHLVDPKIVWTPAPEADPYFEQTVHGEKPLRAYRVHFKILEQLTSAELPALFEYAEALRAQPTTGLRTGFDAYVLLAEEIPDRVSVQAEILGYHQKAYLGASGRQGRALFVIWDARGGAPSIPGVTNPEPDLRTLAGGVDPSKPPGRSSSPPGSGLHSEPGIRSAPPGKLHSDPGSGSTPPQKLHSEPGARRAPAGSQGSQPRGAPASAPPTSSDPARRSMPPPPPPPPSASAAKTSTGTAAAPDDATTPAPDGPRSTLASRLAAAVKKRQLSTPPGATSPPGRTTPPADPGLRSTPPGPPPGTPEVSSGLRARLSTPPRDPRAATPPAAAAPKAVPANPLDSVPPAQQEAVVVLDDDPQWRKFAADALSLQGLNVTAVEGWSGLQRLLLEGNVGVVMLDVRLHGVSGEVLAQRVLDMEELANPPTLFLWSGIDPTELAAMASRLPGCVPLEKSGNIDRLSMAVRGALKARRRMQQLAR